MKNLKLLKTILSFLLISSTVLTLFSCNNETKETDETINSDITEEIATKKTYNYEDYDNKKDYKIICVDNGYRLIFDDPTIYKSLDYHFAGIKFNSMQEFYDDLVNGTLSYNEKGNIYNTFPKDENGIIIFSPNELSTPLTPKDCEINEYFYWIGNRYGYSFKVPFEHPYGDSVTANFRCLTKDCYNQYLAYEKDINNMPEAWGPASIKTVADKEIVTFSIGYEQIRYTLMNENKTMYVMETHIYDTDSTTTYSVVAFYISNGFYFEVMIDGISTPFDPEWLFEFDVEKYVPENT